MDLVYPDVMSELGSIAKGACPVPPRKRLSVTKMNPVLKGQFRTQALQQTAPSFDHLVGAGGTVWGVARRHGLTSQ
jgi:hypothetical protein